MHLTIVTINLNNCKGLQKTIESVLHQDFSEFEYIIVDGDSTDNSVETIKNAAELATVPFYWISEPDNGIYEAMNKGIRMSKGEYLLFLNSGDFLVDNDVLNKVFQIGFSDDITIGNCDVSRNGKVIFHAIPPDEISFAAFYGRTIPHQSAFIKRSLFKKFGLYNENLRLHSDYEFFIKTLIINNCSYHHIPLTIANYNLEGLSSSKNSKTTLKTEYNDIIQRYIPERIIFDYKNWKSEQQFLKPWYWIKRKPIIYNLIIFIHNLAKFLVDKKRNKWNTDKNQPF